MSHEEYTQFENNEKIKLYSSNICMIDHKQIIVEGIRKDRSKYRIICDEGIKDLIIYLNNNNYRTLWSCEGDDNSTAYITVSKHKLSDKKINQLRKIIIDYWKNSFRITEFKEENKLSFYSYSKERWERKLKFYERMSIKTGHLSYFGDILK